MELKMILEINNVYKSFGGLNALKNVSFSLKEREIHALIGPNGAGKTTLINIINGLEKLDSGKVIFKGKEINKLSPHKRAKMGIARTFQHIELFGDMTALENIMVGMYLSYEKGFMRSGFSFLRDEKELIDKSLFILDYINLSHRKNEIASNLPVGEQRLLEIGRALANEPELLLLDEPAAGLNTKETKSLSTLIQKVRDEKGITILIVEHDMELVMGISDFITVLNFGKIIAEGEPLSIQKNPQVISAYLGED
jgi:branched-chain amino acid transport system ATP-binding protein